MYKAIKKFLFLFDAERVHSCVEFFANPISHCPFLMNFTAKRTMFSDEILEQKIFDKDFLNPVGIAGGFDKDAKMARLLTYLGFGFLEVGTVTPKPQKGNEKPRLFRHIEQKSLQNAMGFNNAGLKDLRKRLSQLSPFVVPIGVNIGKNKDTNDDLGDYESLVEGFSEYASYFVINISSPNTKGLRDLLRGDFAPDLTKKLKERTKKPILLKLSPDQDIDEAKNLCSRLIDAGIDGLIINNTSSDLSLVSDAKEHGGISGQAIKEKSFEFFKSIAKEFFGKTLLVSVGGIDSGDEAYRRVRMGANLVQIYTALVFEGPKIVYKINQELAKNLRRDGFEHISQAVGIDID